MSPTIFAIITVFVIGIISFLIGWMLTISKWKEQYSIEEHRRKNLEQKNSRLSLSLKKAETIERENGSRINLLNEDVRQLKRELNRARKNQAKPAKSVTVSTTASKKSSYNLLINELNFEKRQNVELKKQIEKLRKNTINRDTEVEKKEAIKLKAKIKEAFPKKNVRESKKENPASVSSNVSKLAVEYPELKTITSRISIFSNLKQEDDLSLIIGIDETIRTQLNNQGFQNFKQIAMLTSKDLEVICRVLKLPLDRMVKENWASQANQLYYKKYG